MMVTYAIKQKKKKLADWKKIRDKRFAGLARMTLMK